MIANSGDNKIQCMAMVYGSIHGHVAPDQETREDQEILRRHHSKDHRHVHSPVIRIEYGQSITDSK